MATTEPFVQPLDHPIRLPIFEGPLDLLLFLIRKNEIDIYDIPVETVTRQYLEVLYNMEKLSLEVAGEFFVMAATLMHIKSRMLLPKNEQLVEGDGEEEDVDPRWELVQQLLEYKKFKEAAVSIGGLMDDAAKYLPRHFVVVKEEKEIRPLKPTDKIELWNVFNQVLRRLADRITVGEIHDEIVTVADRMEFVLETLKTRRSFLFSDLFKDETYSFSTLVATFLAILELTRLKKLTVEQEEAFEDIRCDRVDEASLELPQETEIEADGEQPPG